MARLGAAIRLGLLAVLPLFGCAPSEGLPQLGATFGFLREAGADFALTIVHTNDVHARLAPIDESGRVCDAKALAEKRCLGGMARVAHEVKRARREAGALLVIDAGDQFQGSLYFTAHKGRDAVEVMNRIGYDVMALGNHEFDDGVETLGRFVAAARFPVLSANLDAPREPALARVKSSVIVDVVGRGVGLVGLTTEDTREKAHPDRLAQVAFRDAANVLRNALRQLSRAGVRHVIVVSHLGHDRDVELARTIAGIDVIVGGHTHTLLSNTDAKAKGPYPTVVKGPTGENVLVVQAGSWTRHVGRIEVKFDGDGRVLAWSGDTIALGREAPEDEEIAALVATFTPEVEAMRGRKVGEIAVSAGGNCRAEECVLGNLVADAMLASTRAQGVEAVITNGGGLRPPLLSGPVSHGDILTALPFQNAISTLSLTGADLREAIEHGLSAIEQGHGRFPQVAGLRYVFSPRHPAGKRLISLEVGDGKGGFRPLDPQRHYRVAISDFLRRGGDGYVQFRDKAVDPIDYGIAMDEALVEYLSANGPLAPRLDGRIRSQ
ncbi:MAG: hypothetical protein FJX47_05095 [Alphaproteobacteria bacterium]|nr:hypothetical protein [Alphaproteobacteria bacterium]